MAQVPAIIYEVIHYPLGCKEADAPYRHATFIWEHRYVCDCCGEVARTLSALFDFDFDRAHDFFIKWGEYTNLADLDRGIEAARELSNSGRSIQ